MKLQIDKWTNAHSRWLLPIIRVYNTNTEFILGFGWWKWHIEFEWLKDNA